MKVKTCPVRIKAAGTQDGTDDGVFEAVVATYDVDSYGDKITPGAFADTLAEWKASGDPIPVLWSHNSFDPECHIGFVEEAEEREGVGLWVKAQLDLDNPKAAQVYRLLKGRRVKQFSFAYDVVEGGFVERIADGNDESYFELSKLRLYEVGPTLIGANQETELLSVKAAGATAPAPISLTLYGNPTAEQVAAAVKGATAATVPAPTTHTLAPPAAKAGRSLSAKNETNLRDAVGLISAVLESLDSDAAKANPTAPATASAASPAETVPAGNGSAPLRHIPGLDRLSLVVELAHADMALAD